jgi:hypothetical protein
VRTLYLGHGAPGGPAVLADQRRYLLMAREPIGRVASGRTQLSEEEANRAQSLMERYLPSAPLGWLVGAGASAVAAELAQDAALACSSRSVEPVGEAKAPENVGGEPLSGGAAWVRRDEGGDLRRARAVQGEDVQRKCRVAPLLRIPGVAAECQLPVGAGREQPPTVLEGEAGEEGGDRVAAAA